MKDKNKDFLIGYKLGILNFQEQMIKISSEKEKEQMKIFMNTIGDLLIDKAEVSCKNER